jgi:hypothetical protein
MDKQMKIHKKNLFCGSSHNEETDDNKKVTCKKCLRLIADDKPNKMYKVEYDYTDVIFIEAATASKAIYKCFKMKYYDDDIGEDIGEQFLDFRKYWKPKARIEKDTSITKTLTYQEEQQLLIDKADEFKDDWNKKYPIGTAVWFQGDGKDKAIITKTTSEALNRNNTYCVIFLDNVSGSYKLDESFVLPYLESNKNTEFLR